MTPACFALEEESLCPLILPDCFPFWLLGSILDWFIDVFDKDVVTEVVGATDGIQSVFADRKTSSVDAARSGFSECMLSSVISSANGSAIIG